MKLLLSEQQLCAYSFIKIIFMLLWQTGVATVQKGREKWDSLPCFCLDYSPFNKEEDEEWAPWSQYSSVVSQYRSQKFTILCSTSHQQKIYTLYLIFFSLHAQFFNQSEHLHLSWELYVLNSIKNHTCETKFFLFSSFKRIYAWKSENFYLKPETHFTTLHSSGHGSNLWQFQDSSEICIFSDIFFYLLKGFEICLFCQKWIYFK